MDTQYLIRKIETCPVCKGAKRFVNEDWQELNMAFDTWMKEHGWVCMNEEAYKEWDRRKAKAFPFGEPPEEDLCGECEGEGKIEEWIDLRQAFEEIGYQFIPVVPVDWKEREEAAFWAKQVPAKGNQ